MRRAPTLLCASILITMLSTTVFAGSITTLRSSRSGSITTLSTGNRSGSITTLRTGSITTLRSGDNSAVSAPETSTGLGRFSISELFAGYFSLLVTNVW